MRTEQKSTESDRLSTRWKRYRIVRDGYCGYEAQVWRWWFPCWVQIWRGGPTNTSTTLEGAEQICRNHKNPVVKNL